MKKGILLVVIILAISFACEKNEEFDYIEVNVIGEVKVINPILENGAWGGIVGGELVKMSLIKDGGERVDYIGTTRSNTGETTIQAVFNLYKEQSIEFEAKLVNHPEIFDYTGTRWKDVDRAAIDNGLWKPRTCSVELYITLERPVQ